jgi:hypothetical protein
MLKTMIKPVRAFLNPLNALLMEQYKKEQQPKPKK